MHGLMLGYLGQASMSAVVDQHPPLPEVTQPGGKGATEGCTHITASIPGSATLFTYKYLLASCL